MKAVGRGDPRAYGSRPSPGPSEADIDAAGKALAGAARPMIHTFLATSAIHLKYKLKITADEALSRRVEGVTLARSLAADVEFSAEDASRTDYALPARGAAGGLRGRRHDPERARHRRLLPPRRVRRDGRAGSWRDIPGAVISVHCHNDLGLAVANSIAAVQAGARQVECTINGIGERAGNTSLEELVMALKVRGEALGAETGVEDRAPRAHQRDALGRSPASGRSPTRRSSAATPSPTRRGSTSTAFSRTR